MAVALVTGASSGIGAATSRFLASRGYHVIAAGRSAQRTSRTVATIHSSGGSAEFLRLDLASLDSCRAAAAEIVNRAVTLDILVNNAGVGPVKGMTSDGFEIHLGVNHLGHFLLTEELEPVLAPGTRVVQLSSHMHHRVDTLDFDAFTRRTRSMFGLDEYAASKLANILFIKELARRHPQLRAYAVHPGLVKTNIIPWYIRPFIRALSPDEGADTVVWCATAPELAQESGQYYANRSPVIPSEAARDESLARRLWGFSLEAVAAGGTPG